MLSLFNLYDGDYKKLLLLPVLLFVISLFLVFVYPGVPLGIDLKGGNMILLRTDMPIDAEVLKTDLLSDYPLQELSITSTSSPDGSHGTIIQFLVNSDLAELENKIREAESLKETNPEQAKSIVLGMSGLFAKYGVNEEINLININDAIDKSKILLVSAKDNFVRQIEKTIEEKFSVSEIKSQTREVGASLGKAFWDSSILVMIVAAILVIIVIFAFFRELVPSLAIIASAILDVVCALAAMAIFSIPLSLSSIPALLMLVGYSVDTDIMLTTRLLKRKEGELKERSYEAMKTGLTMTLTTMAALSVMITLSFMYQIVVIFDLTVVLFFGLVADIISTWLMNAPILLVYAESKRGGK